jgi:hypothetical protein
MQTSIFLAKLLGPAMTLIGLAALLNMRRFRDYAREFIEHPALLFLSSIILLPAGIAMILVHNTWTTDWRVLVTILGWLLAISSTIRLLAPGFVIEQSRNVIGIRSMPAIAGTIWLVIGLIFCLFGYR